MTRRPFISSVSNPRLKSLRRLRRSRGATFIVEGYREVAAALEAGVAVPELYVSPELYLGNSDGPLVSRAERRGTVVTELSGAAFESIAREARPDGIVAVVEGWSTVLDGLALEPTPLILVAEAIERPGNLGTIIRTACAAGADALLVCDGVTDAFHPETVRGSAGALFRVRIAESRTVDAIAWLRAHRVRIIVATPSGQRTHREADFRGGAAVVVGSERHGVSQAWLGAADETVRIPMPGPADSLNVAVAAGVVMCEAAYQRLGCGYARSLP